MKFLTVNECTHTYSDRCLSKVALVQDKYVELQLCQYHAADDVLCKATGQKPNSSQVDLPLEYVPENLSRGYSPGIRGWTAWLENRCAWHCWTPCPHFAAEWNGLGSARLSFLSTCFSSGILEKGLGQHVLRRSCVRPLARRTCVFGCARFCPQCCEGPSIQKHATLEKPELDCSATIANHFLPDFAWSYGPQHFGACRSKRNFRESSSFTTTVRPRKEVGCWVRLVSAFMSPGASFHLRSIGNCSIITIVK